MQNEKCRIRNEGKEYNHIPVLLNETINALNLSSQKTAVDATLGGGGHSRAIAEKIKGGTLVCLDKDKKAIENAEMLKWDKETNVTIVHDDFANIANVLDELKIDKVDAVLADLGVSSHQIDTAKRGFSYMNDAPLDMRMNQNQQKSAYHVVNLYSPQQLAQIIKDYGEERYANRIAANIVKARPVKTTLELAEIIKNSVPSSYYKTGGHPAKRTFQAIRIEVNGELEVLEKFIKDSTARLNTGGRLAIISFHSLEDRIVKQTMKLLATDCICPPRIPVCICGHRSTLKVIAKKPIEASHSELKTNPRAASAKLRIAERK